MAPTTSTTLQLMFGDLLTIALMRKKKFTLDDYALNHPSGRIGKRMTLKVLDLMLKDEKIPLCHPDDSLKEILVELSNKRCGCVLVVDAQKRLKGIFTDGDLRRALQQKGESVLSTPVNQLMCHSPQWIMPQMLAWDALKLVEETPKKGDDAPSLGPPWHRGRPHPPARHPPKWSMKH